MRLFLDSANLDDIKEALEIGIISGVTTNPSLLAKEPKSGYIPHIVKIADMLNGAWTPSGDGEPPHLSIEVFETDVSKMVEQAVEFKRLVGYRNLVIKIPMGWKELVAIRRLREFGIDTNCTCIFKAGQAILAMESWADYVSFFTNRMKDRGIDVAGEIDLARRKVDDSIFDTKIICGSIRKPEDVMECFMAGAHIVTCSLPILKQLAYHEGTVDSVNKFLSDFREWQS